MFGERLNITYKDNTHIQAKVARKKRELSGMDDRFDRQMKAYEGGVINLEQLQKYKEKLTEEKKILKRKYLTWKKNFLRNLLILSTYRNELMK